MVAQDPPAVAAALAPGPMRRPYVRLLAAGMLAVMVGCGDDQDTPTEPTTTAPTTTTPANRAPQASQSIPDQTVLFGDDAQLDMGSYFTDPDGDTLTYEATSSNTHVATVSVSGSTVTLSTMNLGRANVMVTARDPDGLTATQSFTVMGERPPNRAPESSSSVPDRTLKLDEDETANIDMNRYFTDPDGDTLTYEATSSNTHVAMARVSGSTVTLTASHLGRANVRVTARDPDGLTATQRFSVTVEQGGPAGEVDVTTCRHDGALGLPRVTMAGTVRALRRLSSVTVTGYVDTVSPINRVGEDNLGDIPAGQTRSFRIEGTSPIPISGSFTCRVNVTGRVGASAPAAFEVLSLEGR